MHVACFLYAARSCQAVCLRLWIWLIYLHVLRFSFLNVTTKFNYRKIPIAHRLTSSSIYLPHNQIGVMYYKFLFSWVCMPMIKAILYMSMTNQTWSGCCCLLIDPCVALVIAIARVYQFCSQYVISHTYHGSSYGHASVGKPCYSCWSRWYRSYQL